MKTSIEILANAGFRITQRTPYNFELRCIHCGIGSHQIEHDTRYGGGWYLRWWDLQNNKHLGFRDRFQDCRGYSAILARRGNLVCHNGGCPGPAH